MPNYCVKQGDCIASISYQFGYAPDTLWNHPQNADLKTKRKDPHVLNPGDQVFLPEKELRTEARPTEALHKFVRQGAPETLRLVLLDYDLVPRPSIKYGLEIDGSWVSGVSDAQGVIECPITPGAKQGKLTLTEEQEEYTLNLGHLDPITEVSGVQGRLNNLGFDCGPVDGKLGPHTESAITRFQEKEGLSVSGQLDDETRERIEKVHGF